MFRNILENLSFNPSLIDQVISYRKRLQKEAAIRAVSLTMIVVAVLIQLFAALYSSNSYNTNYDCSLSQEHANSEAYCTVKDSVVQTSATLPYIDPAISLLIGFLVIVLLSYLFIRVRIMIRELTIIRKEYTSAGDF